MTVQDEINQRVVWLERKMMQVLYLLISILSTFVGWAVANFTIGEKPGWVLGIVFVVTWLVVALILHRSTFRGAPSHIQFIDP